MKTQITVEMKITTLIAIKKESLIGKAGHFLGKSKKLFINKN